MKPLTNIFRKEVKELLTPAAIIPVVVMAVLFAALGGMIGGAQQEASKAPVIGLIDMDGGNYSHVVSSYISANSEITYNGTDVDVGLETVRTAGGPAVIVIEEDFTSNISSGVPGTIRVYWIMAGAGIMDSVSSSIVDAILSGAGQMLSAKMIEEGASTNSSLIMAPMVKSETTYFKQMTMDDISPSTVASVLSSQSFLIPLVVMLVILMSGSSIIGSMGMEKENKTLETLLTMPVKRRDIVLGKLAGAAVVGLLMAIVYMAGMGYYMGSLQGQSAIDMTRFGLVLDPLDYLLVGLSLFLAVLGALALCMLLGAFARDFKSSQTLTMPITFLALVPFFIMMMKDFNTLPPLGQAVIFLIPFSHPMMVMNNLMFNDYWLVIAGIAYEALFAAVTVGLSVWLFKKDMLITGWKKGSKKAFGGLLKKGR
ncbi:MAG: ABC transporter permease [Methanomassiliicoccus sp.]|nr:ABC transporter permease [Methanomassiliicoccus sp.]